MNILTYKLIYILNALVFLCLGCFFSLRWFALHRRKSEPFLVAIFTMLSISYVLHSLTYVFQSHPIFVGALWVDFIVATAGVLFLGIVIGKEGIPPFNFIYSIYVKLTVRFDNYKFKKHLKKITKDKI